MGRPNFLHSHGDNNVCNNAIFCCLILLDRKSVPADAAPTILFPAAKRPAFVYNQHGFIRKETEKATHVCQKVFEVDEVEG